MSERQNPLNNGDWRRLAQAAEPYVPAFAIAMAAIAVPLALLYLTPLALGLFAPRLDPNIDLYAVNRPLAFTFLDVNGNEVGHRGAIVGERLKLEEMPAFLPAAFIAMEDRRFYYHNGIDPLGLGRALLLDLRARHWVSGGSTISQQTAKIVYTNQQRTMSRKLIELIDAAGLEKSLSKQQILQLYLNRIYLGSGAYGVDGAAKRRKVRGSRSPASPPVPGSGAAPRCRNRPAPRRRRHRRRCPDRCG
jgi:penicillin-binding protein 1A